MSNLQLLKNNNSLNAEFCNGTIHLNEDQMCDLSEAVQAARAKDGCMVDNKQERLVYKLLKNIILPSLEDYVRSKNPVAYEAYCGNMCRHASLVACHTLKKVLPEWEWNIYEITYSATIFNEAYICTHAFVIGKRGDEYRAVDMWDSLSAQLYAPIDSIRYPFEYDEIEKNREVISLKEVSYTEMCKLDDEFLLGNVPVLLRDVDMCIELADALCMLQ